MSVHLYRVSFHHPDNGSSEVIIPLSTASEKEAEEERRKFLEFAFVDKTGSGGVCPWKTGGDASTSKEELDDPEYECWIN